MPGPKAPQAERRQQILDAAYGVALDEGIDGLTLRAVAARARVSHGLVVFHFKERNQLVAALLDRVLAETAARSRAIAAPDARATAAEQLSTLLRHEMNGLVRDPRWLRLFLEYWALGVRDRRVRRKISAALRGYRSTFRLVPGGARDASVTRAPEASGASDATADAIAAVAVSLVSGYALQATIERGHVDASAYARLVDRVVACVLDPAVAPRSTAVRRGVRQRGRPRPR